MKRVPRVRTALPREALRAALDAADRGRRVLVATVLRRRGSTPSTPGQKLALMLLTAFVTTMACSAPSSPSIPSSPSSSSPPSSPSSSSPPSSPSSSPPSSPPPAADRCTTIAARFRATLAAGTGACSVATDCGCYNPVAAGLGCGGVTDATTVAALAAIEVEFHAASCAWPLQCAAWACQPRCQDGRCVK